VHPAAGTTEQTAHAPRRKRSDNVTNKLSGVKEEMKTQNPDQRVKETNGNNRAVKFRLTASIFH
jgi:hypothetical protein